MTYSLYKNRIVQHHIDFPVICHWTSLSIAEIIQQLVNVITEYLWLDSKGRTGEFLICFLKMSFHIPLVLIQILITVLYKEGLQTIDTICVPVPLKLISLGSQSTHTQDESKFTGSYDSAVIKISHLPSVSSLC